jgi:hypothetical protein
MTESSSALASFLATASQQPSTEVAASSFATASSRATRSATATRTATATSTGTTTGSITPTPSSTISLGIRLVVEKRAIQALSFDITLSPASAADISSPAVGQALRSSVVSQLELTGVGALDRVFIAAVFESKTGRSTIFNDSAPLNRAGNFYSDVDAAVSALLSGAALKVSSPSPPKSRVLQEELAFNRDTSRAVSARRLELALAFVNTTRAADPESKSSILRFNVLYPSAATAAAGLAAVKAMAAADLLDTAAADEAAAAALAAARVRRVAASTAALAGAFASVSDSSALNATAKTDPTSAKVVELVYTKSFFGIFLEWLQKNIVNVLAGTCAVIVCFLLLIGIKRALTLASEKAKAEKRARTLKFIEDFKAQCADSIRAAYDAAELSKVNLSSVALDMNEEEEVPHVTAAANQVSAVKAASPRPSPTTPASPLSPEGAIEVAKAFRSLSITVAQREKLEASGAIIINPVPVTVTSPGSGKVSPEPQGSFTDVLLRTVVGVTDAVDSPPQVDVSERSVSGRVSPISDSPLAAFMTEAARTGFGGPLPLLQRSPPGVSATAAAVAEGSEIPRPRPHLKRVAHRVRAAGVLGRAAVAAFSPPAPLESPLPDLRPEAFQQQLRVSGHAPAQTSGIAPPSSGSVYSPTLRGGAAAGGFAPDAQPPRPRNALKKGVTIAKPLRGTLF